jgi:predicted amidohydrolase YtcJ
VRGSLFAFAHLVQPLFANAVAIEPLHEANCNSAQAHSLRVFGSNTELIAPPRFSGHRPANLIKAGMVNRSARICAVSFAALSCATPAATNSVSPAPTAANAAADLILTHARVYTLDWDEPNGEGQPAANAPYDAEKGWRPDAQAVAIRGGELVYVGHLAGLEGFKGARTKIIDLGGATIIPGLVDSHTHVVEWGQLLSKVDLTGINSESEAIDRIEARAKNTPKGEWVLAWGFDEGAWADHMPDNNELSRRIPDHPVHVNGLHGFATWSNKLALEKAGIDGKTKTEHGGKILLDASGQPTGVLIDKAGQRIDAVIPRASAEAAAKATLEAMNRMAAMGYIGIHEAGANRYELSVFQDLASRQRLPIRVYAMLKLTDRELINEWIARGPQREPQNLLTIGAIKAYYDASLGARGARLLADYSDQPGHRGVSGANYGFDSELAGRAMAAGFQLAIHAIGDAGNRETLDFYAKAFADNASLAQHRHRIEHAQIVHPDDRPRFAALGILASMEPPHAVEDKAWAEARLGVERAGHGYAWRSLRREGATILFNSDLAGSSPDIFYGLHAAITRRDLNLEPKHGWYAGQALRPEEAIRAYTRANRFGAFEDDNAGILRPGKWADLTVMNIDPFQVGEKEPGNLLQGKILMTIVDGKIVYSALE